MSAALTVHPQQRNFMLRYWLPAIAAATVAWLAFLFAGETPFIRASGLAVVILGVALALRRMGAVLAVGGSLTLAFSPAFWSQTGGTEGDPATIVLAIIAAVVAVLLTFLLKQQPYVVAGIGVTIFILLFFSQIGTPRSLRLTGLVVAWLMYLLVDMLLITNPRPDSPAAPLLLRYKRRDGTFIDANAAQPYHTLGILLFFCLGVLNDPLIALLAPGIVVALLLTRTPLPVWYWAILMLFVGVGIRGFYADYWLTQAHWLAFDRWREATRWIDMIQFVVTQFGYIGIVISVLGLARLARWYPPLGTTLSILYACYLFFGLIYLGPNRGVLLLPLLIIQIVWMTYAIFAMGEWGANLLGQRPEFGRLVVRAVFLIYPALLFARVAGIV